VKKYLSFQGKFPNLPRSFALK